ncbi:glycosyltransferase family 2 protein [Candidatus Woesebacteria bacterium]|nr:glycosyltransferase family 2 protein [Candidatus Woesebacteria bacterium]
MAPTPKSKKLDASIIIVNFNGKSLLGACLKSLQTQSTSHTFEIIVVDNASTDGSVDYLFAQFPDVIVVQENQNSGFGRANNLGASRATGEYLIFLNADTEVEPTWLFEMLTVAQSNPKIAAVSPRVYLYATKGNQKKVQNAGILVFKQGFATDRGVFYRNGVSDYELDSKFYDQPTTLPACCGVSLLVKTDAFTSIGGFDHDYFMYYEDVDLSLRLRQRGYLCEYAPKAIVWHHHGASSQIASPFFIFHTERSRILFVAKHFPLSTLLTTVFFYLGFISVAFARAVSMLLQSDFSQMNRWLEITRLRCSVLLQVVVKIPQIIVRTRTKPTWIAAMNLYETFL